jgi:hypothetical protein
MAPTKTILGCLAVAVAFAMPSALARAQHAPATSTPTSAPTWSSAPSPTARSTVEPSATPLPTASPIEIPLPVPGGTFAAGTVDVPGLGFSITLADGWQAVPLRATDLEQQLATLLTSSNLGSMINSELGKMVLEGVKLWAIDLRPSSMEGGIAPTLNVIASADQGLPLELVMGATLQQLGSTDGVTNLKYATLSLPIGKAAEILYDLQVAGSSISLQTSGAQYLVKIGTNVVVLTFSCDATNSGPCIGDAQGMMQSLVASPSPSPR